MSNNTPKNLFHNVGVLVDIKNKENFLKIKETLTRIGIANVEDKKLVQSCHILHKRDIEGNSHYSIVHFKEMFKLDNKHSTITETDILRRNFVVSLLEDWDLVDILEDIEVDDDVGVKVISFKEKAEWTLIEKYRVGKKSKS